MSPQEFKEFRENEGWEDDDGDDDDKMEYALSFEGLTELTTEWKRLVHAAAGLTLDSYSEDVEADRRLLGDQEALGKLSGRERRALHVRYGQKNILERLQQLTKSSD